MKKFLVFLLTLTLILSAAIPAFAAGNGTITINGVNEDVVYDVYKLLDLQTYDTTAGAYSYVKNTEWAEFFETDEAKEYISFETADNKGYAVWVAGDDAEKTAKFAKLALKWAQDHDIAPVKSSEEGDFVITGTTGVFSGLEMGYYLVDSDMGALCGLTTTNPNASVNAKNGIPTIDKQVNEDSTSQWGDKNSADIGQIVDFRVTINVHAGAENYVLHDNMGAGFKDFQLVNIEHVIPGTTETRTDVPDKYYELKVHPNNAYNDYNTTYDHTSDGCAFEIHFTQEFCEHLEVNDKVIVTYKAMLNREAVIAGDGNVNVAWLAFGGNSTGPAHATEPDRTITYTYGVDIIKTDSQNVLLDGAEFRIYDAAEGGNEIKVVLMDDGESYRRARNDEDGTNIVVTNGKMRVEGLDNGTYYLEEKVQPAGYNILSSRQRFIVADGNLDAVFNGDVYSTGSGVHVVNKTGSMLPETGGFGTTMFMLIGGFAVLAAGILLFVNKRMSKIAE